MPTAVITGANRGLGLEFARQLLSREWRVHALNRGVAPALADLPGADRLVVHRGDLADPAELRRLSGELSATRIDLLLNNAGIMKTDTPRHPDHQTQGLHDFSRDEWRAVFEINLFSPAQLIALLRPRLAAGARVVTLSSAMAGIADNEYGGWYAYRASKAAVNSLMKSVALELGDAVIAVALHPGWVRTDMGGPDADLDAATAVAGMLQVIDDLTPADSGAFIGYDGSRAAY